jgi:hypothetical protein
MTPKQQIHHLGDELPVDSPLLAEIREVLQLNRALGEAANDIRAGHVHSAEDFMAKVEERWPFQHE